MDACMCVACVSWTDKQRHIGLVFCKMNRRAFDRHVILPAGHWFQHSQGLCRCLWPPVHNYCQLLRPQAQWIHLKMVSCFDLKLLVYAALPDPCRQYPITQMPFAHVPPPCPCWKKRKQMKTKSKKIKSKRRTALTVDSSTLVFSLSSHRNS